MAFKRTFMDIADKRAPFMTMRIRSSTLPWLNEDIRNLIKERNFNHKKAQKSGSCIDWATYRAIRNQVVSQIRNAKRNYYTNLIEENITNFPDSTTPSLLENKNFVIVSGAIIITEESFSFSRSITVSPPQKADNNLRLVKSTCKI